MTLKTVWICIILALAAILAGCAAPATGPATAPATAAATAPATAPATSQTGCLVIDSAGLVTLVDPCDPATEARRDRACKEVVPFDGSAAYDNVDYTEPLGWSLAVNFDETLSGNPPACLRLYYRDDTPDVEAYMPIDGGGILVETCQIAGTLPIVHDHAQFCADETPKGVACNVNLGAWAQDPKTQNYVAPVYPGVNLPQLLTDFGSASSHTYATMALIGTVNWDNCTLPPRRMPLITYSAPQGASPQPQLLLASAPSVDTLPLAISGDFPAPEEKAEVVGFPELCTDGKLAGKLLNWEPSAEPQVVAWDQRRAALAYDSYVMQVHLPPLPDPVQDGCVAGKPVPSVELWQEDAQLLIGMETDPPSNSTFLGNVDGVLIDPFDSKPATSADK